jgi:predicted DNA-binding protein (UPF0251 family)
LRFSRAATSSLLSTAYAMFLVKKVKMSVDELEALRGGDPPEEGEDEEEWDDNWRIPRQYFADEVVSIDGACNLL